MSRRVWRIVKAEHVSAAFDGEGARLFGGRWNSKGTPVVYVAGSLSLAALEMLAHIRHLPMLSDFVSIRIEFPERIIQRLDADVLSEDWRAQPATRATKAIGDRWASDGESAVLQVPSVVIPVESNYLLNPAHPDFEKIVIGEPIPFSFDPRFSR